MKSHYNPELRYPQSPYGQGYLYPMTKHIHTVGFGRGSVASVEARTDTAAQPGLAGQRSFLEKMARALVGIASFPLLVAAAAFSILIVGFAEIIKPGGISVLLTPFILTGRIADKIFKFSGLTDSAPTVPEVESAVSPAPVPAELAAAPAPVPATSESDESLSEIEEIREFCQNTDGTWNIKNIINQITKDANRTSFSIQIDSTEPKQFNKLDRTAEGNFVFILDAENVATLLCTNETLKLLSLCHQGAVAKAWHASYEKGMASSPAWLPSQHHTQFSIKCDQYARVFSIDITYIFSKHYPDTEEISPEKEALKITISPTQYRFNWLSRAPDADLAAASEFASRQAARAINSAPVRAINDGTPPASPADSEFLSTISETSTEASATL